MIAFGYITAFLLAACLSAFATWGVRNFALQRELVSAPASARHIHKRAVPRLGGIAIFGSVITILLLAFMVSRIAGFDFLNFHKLSLLIIPAVPVFLLGVYDDLRDVRPWMKFSAQIFGAGLLYAFGFRVSSFGLFFGNEALSSTASLALTIFWVVLVTNAFNLIDGLDGLAAGSSLFSIFVIAIVAIFFNSPTVALLALTLAGAVLGFLKFNFNPATIFLGDCGSLFLGFSLAALSISASYKAPTIIAIAIPLVACGLPITDTVLAVVRRFLSGKPLFSADREHIHHKLLDRGLTQKQSAIVLYGVSAAFGLASIFLLYPHGSTLAVVLLLVFVLMLAGISKLGYLEFAEIERLAVRTVEQREIIKNNLLLRRGIQALRECRSAAEIADVLNEALTSNDFDGFRLRLNRSVHANGDRKDFQHELWKPQHQCTESEMWELRLPLASGNRNLGELTLLRMYGKPSLMLDVNVLTSDFLFALSKAAERATTPVSFRTENYELPGISDLAVNDPRLVTLQ